MSDDGDVLPRPTTALSVAEHLGLPLAGADGPIVRFGSFPPLHPQSISFLQVTPPIRPTSSPAFALVLAKHKSLEWLKSAGYSVIVTDYPKFHLASALADLCSDPPIPGIDASAVIGPDVQLDEGVAVGPFAVLSGRVRVGRASVIGSHVRLLHEVRIGAGCVIRSGSVIGGDAFNFGMGASGATRRLPSFGSVKLGDRVDIGHNVVISRAIAGQTSIGDGVLINDLSMIGNAVSIEADAVIMASTMVGGRVTIGRGAWVGMAARILESVTIGERAKVGMGSVVMADVAPGTVVVGVPARYLRENV